MKFLRIFHIMRTDGIGGIFRRIQIKMRIGSTVKSAYGIRFASNFGDATFRMYVSGAYGSYYWDRLHSKKEPFIFVDIGANQGLYTICAAKNPNCIRSYAFEPTSRTHRLLIKNIDLNRVKDKCEVHNLAISDEMGTCQISASSTHSGGATLSKSRIALGGFNYTEMIKTVNHNWLNDLFADENYPIIVKVDVEGFEHTVISELLKSRHNRRIDELFYEVDESWVSSEKLLELLEKNGFQKIRSLGEGSHYDVLATRGGAHDQ